MVNLRSFGACFLAILIAATSSSRARADYELVFSQDGGGSFINSVQTGVNDLVSVELFIREAGGTSLSTEGLSSFRVVDNFSTGLVGSTSFAANSAFDGNFGSSDTFDSGTGVIDWGASVLNLPPPNGAPITGSVVSLGTFSLLTTGVGSTTFSLSNISSGSAFLVGDPLLNNSLDSILFAGGQSYDFTVTAVPEPSSLALVGLASAGAAGYWRKKKAKKAEATAV